VVGARYDATEVMQGVTECWLWDGGGGGAEQVVYALPRRRASSACAARLCRSGGVRGVIPTEFPQAREEPSSKSSGKRRQNQNPKPH